MNMKLEELRELIRLMKDNQIAEIDLEEEGKRVRVVSQQAQPAGMTFTTMSHPMMASGQNFQPEHSSAPAPAPALDPPKKIGVTVDSPIVGTFYAAPTPESPPFVREGDEVEEGALLCIVEAMKVMNEIRAELTGKIVEILAENGHPVEFGQPLFRVLPA